MSYSLGQATVTTVTRTERVDVPPGPPMSDTAKIGVGLGAFALLGGLGYLAWKYPTPMFGGGMGYGIGYGGGPGLMLRMNRRNRRGRR